MPTVDTILKLIESTSGAYGTGASNNTPVSLAKEMINNLKVDWYNPKLTILDPCCGYGTFLVVAYGKLREHGHSPKHIVENMLFGNDICKTKATIAASVLSKLAENDTTIYNEDFLGGGFDDMKFGVVVGNPPFQETHIDGKRKDQASNLWSTFWYNSIEKLTTDDGQIALITPTSWMSPSADKAGKKRLWDIFNSYSSYAEVDTVADHFNGIGSTFGYVVVNKKGNEGLKFSKNYDTSLGFLPKSNIDFCIENLSKTRNIRTVFGPVKQSSVDDTVRVSIPMTRRLNPDSFEILTDKQKPTMGSDNEGLYLYVTVNNLEEANLVKNRLIECISILNDYCRWSGFLNIKIVEMIKI